MPVAGDGEYADVLAGLGAFVDSVVIPLERENVELLDNPRACYAEDGRFSARTQELMRTVRMTSAEAGYYAMFAPSEVGGGGQGQRLHYLAWEYLHHRYGPGRLLPYQTLSHWATGPSHLCSSFSARARERWLDDIVSGRCTLSFGMSEAEAGSDAWLMSTRAVIAGDNWVINGGKQWTTNAPTADCIIIFAVTDAELHRERSGGVSAFLVPTTAAGFSVDSVIKLFGEVGGNEAIVSLENVTVPQHALVGELGRGFDLALSGVSLGRMYNAARCVGLAMWALERSVAYATQRKTFGQRIIDHQGVSFMLAESAMEIYAARTMARDCAARMDSGIPSVAEMNMVKAYATEMGCRVYDRSMQVHGGMGLTNEMRLFDGWHQARSVRIADGSGEIMRRNIVRALEKGQVTF